MTNDILLDLDIVLFLEVMRGIVTAQTPFDHRKSPANPLA
jgi:hypothetical protein